MPDSLGTIDIQKKSKSLSFRAKLFLISISLIFISLSLVTGVFYKISFDKIESLIGEKLSGIAASSSLFLNTKNHDLIVEDLLNQKKDISNTTHFKEFRNQLKQIKDKNQLEQDIYTVIVPEWANGNMIFIAMSNEKPYTGNGMKAHPLVIKALKTKLPQFTGLYSDHEGSWVSGFSPLFNDNGEAIAVLEIDYSANEEIRNIRNDFLKLFIAPFFLIFLLIIFSNLFIANIISKPIKILIKNANKISNGDYNISFLERFSGEFGVLMDTFSHMASSIEISRKKIEDYAHNLEDKVKEKTFELASSKQDVENILNNVSQGFFTFDKSGLIGPNYSRIVEDFFDGSPVEKYFNHYLSKYVAFDDEKFSQWLELCFSGRVPFDSMSGLLPESFVNFKERKVDLSYRPLLNEDNELIKVICVAEDKTYEQQLKRESFEKQEYARFIIGFIQNKENFEDYREMTFLRIEKMKELIIDQNFSTSSDRINKDVLTHDLYEFIFREVHTIKGDSAYNHVLSVKEEAARFEDFLAKRKNDKPFNLTKYEILDFLNSLNTKFSNFLEQNKKLIILNDNQDNNSVKFDEYEKILAKLVGENSELYKKFRDDFILKDASSLLSKYENLVAELANQQNKKINFKINNKDDFKVDVRPYKSFVNSCVHLFRNAVDHGIESLDERLENEKDETSNISISMYEDIDNKKMKVLVSDDGRGLNTDMIKAKSIESGIMSENSNLKEIEIWQHIFKPGFSTKDVVTDISGRGVGLDALKSEVDNLKGKIIVKNNETHGASFYIEIPLFN